MYHKKTMAKGGKMRDNNLANNYPPYDKITRGDVIAGRLGKDQMGGKNKMAKGGNMKKGQAYKMYEITKEGLNGQYSYYSDKQGKTIKADTREEILREIEKEKKMAKGGKMYAKGGLTEHGLRTGDSLGRSADNSVIVYPYNKNERGAKVVNLNVGKRIDAKEYSSMNDKERDKFTKMAKGGKTKSKQDPPIIRGYVDDEPYEYGDGGTMNCWCYDIGGL